MVTMQLSVKFAISSSKVGLSDIHYLVVSLHSVNYDD